MYRSVNDQVSSYISDLIPPPVGEDTAYTSRNQNRTELSKTSCIPSSISLRNNLDDNIRTSASLNSFKYRFKRPTPTSRKFLLSIYKQSWFLSMMQSRIWNNCSSLFNDLYINHLISDPMCTRIRGNENAIHFFPSLP